MPPPDPAKQPGWVSRVPNQFAPPAKWQSAEGGFGAVDNAYSMAPYLVMDLLEGQSLRALMDSTDRLSLELAADVALQVCECLAEAHELGIIHRDLKPDNVFLCPKPGTQRFDVKVLDFGVVKVDANAIPESSLTRAGTTIGTPHYMSLEQLRNASAVDARTRSANPRSPKYPSTSRRPR